MSGGQRGQYTRSPRPPAGYQSVARVAAVGPVEGHAPVAQRDVRVVADDQVVEQLDVEQTARGEGLGRQVEVVRGGRRVARRMVVDQDHARRVEPDGVAEELADTHQRRADVALVDRRDAQDVVLGVEHHDPQLLAFEATHLEDQPIRDVVRAADRPARGRPVGEQPAPELEGRDQLGRLGFADAGHRGELQLGGPGETGQAVVAGERVRGEIDRGPAARPRAPDQADQLGRRQATDPAHREPLPRPLLDRHLPDRPTTFEGWHQSSPNRESAPWARPRAKAGGEPRIGAVGRRGEGGGEHASERTSRCVSEHAEPPTHASAFHGAAVWVSSGPNDGSPPIPPAIRTSRTTQSLATASHRRLNPGCTATHPAGSDRLAASAMTRRIPLNAACSPNDAQTVPRRRKIQPSARATGMREPKPTTASPNASPAFVPAMVRTWARAKTKAASTRPRR